MSITARDNFRRMMMREGAAWLPVDLQFTPPVYEQIKRELGAQDPVEHFKLDFRCVWVRASANESEWREAYKRLGVDLPENAEVGWAGITHLRPPAHTIGKAHHL